MLLISDLMLETRMQLQPVINPLLAHHQAQIETLCFFRIVKDQNSDFGQRPNGNARLRTFV